MLNSEFSQFLSDKYLVCKHFLPSHRLCSVSFTMSTSSVAHDVNVTFVKCIAQVLLYWEDITSQYGVPCSFLHRTIFVSQEQISFDLDKSSFNYYDAGFRILVYVYAE